MRLARSGDVSWLKIASPILSISMLISLLSTRRSARANVSDENAMRVSDPIAKRVVRADTSASSLRSSSSGAPISLLRRGVRIDFPYPAIRVISATARSTCRSRFSIFFTRPTTSSISAHVTFDG